MSKEMTDGVRIAVSSIIHLSLSILAAGLLISLPAFAQSNPGVSKSLPETTISTDTGAPSGAPASTSTEGSATHAAKPKPHRPISSKPTPSASVEPADAMLKLASDSWAYSHPASSSAHIEKVRAGKFVKVTGSTRYYVQVKLKSGKTAYVPIKAVELIRPADKIFRLTRNTPVLSEPNRFGKRLAEVHNGHDVHVVGTSLNYMKIRMKDGLEGYIPTTALE
jgi:hypothetical protein